MASLIPDSNSYNLILLIVCIWGLILDVVFPKRRELVSGRLESRWNPVISFLFIFPFILIAGFRPDHGFDDTYSYRIFFKNAPQVSSLNQLLDLVAFRSDEWGYYLVLYLFKLVFGNRDVLFFTLIAAFQLFSVNHVYRKYSDNYLFSFFVFFASGTYFSYMCNGMRQFIAVTIIFLNTRYILERRFGRVFAVIIIASLFHISALIMIPILFFLYQRPWNMKAMLIIGIGFFVFFVIGISGFASIIANTSYASYGEYLLSGVDDGTHPLRALVFSVPALLAFMFRKKITSENSMLINICVNSSVVTAVLYFLSVFTSGILVGRLPIYVSLYSNGILLPWIIKKCFTSRSRIAVYFIAILFFYCYFALTLAF